MGNYCSPEQLKERVSNEEQQELLEQWEKEQTRLKKQIKRLQDENKSIKSSSGGVGGGGGSEEVGTLAAKIQELDAALQAKENDIAALEEQIREKDEFYTSKEGELMNMRALNSQLNKAITKAEHEKSRMDGVEIHISCRNLPNTDWNSLTDAFVVVYLLNEQTGVFEEITRTETLFDSLDPAFMRSVFISPFDKDAVTGNGKLRFWVYDMETDDADNQAKHLKKQHRIGYCDLSVDEIVKSYFDEANPICAGAQLIDKNGKPVEQKKGVPAMLRVESVEWFSMAEFSQQSTLVMAMEFALGHSKFKKKPYFELFRRKNDSPQLGWSNEVQDEKWDVKGTDQAQLEKQFVKIYTSDVLAHVKENLYRSAPFALTSYTLSMNEYDRPLYVKLYEEKMKKGKPRCVSRAVTSLNALLQGKNQGYIDMHLDLLPEERKKNEENIKKDKKKNLFKGSGMNLRSSWECGNNKVVKGMLPMSNPMSLLANLKLNVAAQKLFEDDSMLPNGWVRLKDEYGFYFFIDDKGRIQCNTMDAAAAPKK